VQTPRKSNERELGTPRAPADYPVCQRRLLACLASRRSLSVGIRFSGVFQPALF
jgi:hypothetical protein